MKTATAETRTAHASRYLRQICKHFGHDIAVDFTPEHGRIAAPAGTCKLDATPDRLTIAVEAEDDASLRALKDAVARQLAEFAFQEELRITWSAGDPPRKAN